MNPSRLVTIKDVAKEAGVSIGAVSKVLHGRGGNIRVSEATAQRIRDAARALNYRPNYHARSLRIGRSRSVGLVVARAQNESDQGIYPQYLQSRLVRILHAKGYSLNLAPELMPLSSIEGLSDGRFDGLVWVDVAPVGPLVEAFYASPVPVVAIGGIYDTLPERGALFLTDEEPGCRVLVDHLLQFGHRHVLYSDRPSETFDIVGEVRRQTFERVAKESGLEVVSRAAEGPEEAFALWRSLDPRPTAIVAYSDRHGALLMQEAWKAGLRLPEDLSVASFEGSPLTLWAWPGLTTMRPPVDEMVDQATAHLIGQMEQTPPAPTLTQFVSILHPAGSTGPAARA